MASGLFGEEVGLSGRPGHGAAVRETRKVEVVVGSAGRREAQGRLWWALRGAGVGRGVEVVRTCDPASVAVVRRGLGRLAQRTRGEDATSQA